MEENKIQNKLPNQEIDYFKIGKILLSRWYWIAGSLIICMIMANIYLWYTPKSYATNATMKFEEKKSEISDLTGGITTGVDRTTSRIQSETIVLQSTPVILSAIKQLDYRISYYIKGRIINRTSEIYPQKPLNVELVKFDSLDFFHGLITFQPIDNVKFSLQYKLGENEYQKIYSYNDPFSIGPTSFDISYPGKLSKTSVFLFKLNSPEELIGRVRSGFRTAETAKNSNIINLQETDSNPQFAADILNAIMKQYLLYDADQKRQSASNMIEFIDSQLEFLSGQVKGSANSIAEYKGKTKIMDVAAASAAAITKTNDLESQRLLLRTQLLGFDKLKQQMLNDRGNLSVDSSSSAGVAPELSQYVENINNLINKRNDMLKKTFLPNSKYVIAINQEILQSKANALATIDLSYTLLQTKLKYLDGMAASINQQLAALPLAQRDLNDLQRGFDINDKVYSFLSEKKLDAQINSAGILPGATIVDYAGVNTDPVSPNEHEIHQTAITIGFLIGLGMIILIRILNPYIYDKETIESLTTIPILGIIRKFPEPIDEDSTQILAISKPRSIFAESVRSVRTNLSFLASEKASKIICITSEVAGEGKSFVAVNLASTLSIIDKKVILIAADLRRSKIHKTFNVPNDKGLSNYLANQCKLDDIILHSQQESLDFMVSGPVPPNPSELLHTNRMTGLIDELKLKYDVIMFDTAPIGLVSDAIPLIRMSDINIFVIRSGKSKFYSATVPQRIAQEYHLDNTCIILNAFSEDLLHSRYYTTKFTGEAYGTRYYYYSDYTGYESSGYYLDGDKTKWWNIKSWFKK